MRSVNKILTFLHEPLIIPPTPTERKDMRRFNIVSVETELYEAGTTEDGTPFIAELYLVVVQNLDGSRWVHRHHFLGAEEEVSEDGFSFFGDIREEALAKANALARRVGIAGEINLDHWVEFYPLYGSPAYEKNPMHH